MEWVGRMNSIRSRTDAGLCPASPCGWNTMGQQKVHEYEAPGSHGAGEPGGLIAARSQSVKGKASGVPPPLTLFAPCLLKSNQGAVKPPPVIDFYQSHNQFCA